MNVSETMASVRFLLRKYHWMADAPCLPPSPGRDLRRSPPLTAAERAKIRQMRQRGALLQDIAHALNRGQTTIHRALARNS